MKSILKDAEVNPREVRIDPHNPNYTVPRTWGVYHLLGDGGKTNTKAFRFGNHPIRLKELEREFGMCITVALYSDRSLAKERADLENDIGSNGGQVLPFASNLKGKKARPVPVCFY